VLGVRVALAGGLWIAFVGLSHLIEGSLYPERRTALAISLLGGIGSLGLAFWVIRRSGRARLAAVLLIAALQLDLGLLNAVVGGDAHSLVIAIICQIGLAPVIMMWDGWAQLAASAAGVLGYLTAVVGGARTDSMPYDVVALAAVSVGSVAGAKVLNDARARLFAQAKKISLERDRAQAASRALERRNEFLAAIQEMIGYTANPQPLATLLNRVLGSLLAVLERSAGAIHLRSADGAVLELCAVRGFTEPLPRELERIDDPRSIVWHAIEQGAPVARDGHAADLLPLGAAQFRDPIVVPIVASRGGLGTITVLGRAERGFTDEDVQLLAMMANQLGVVLEHARLTEENRQKLEILERQGNALARASQAKTDFLNTISHEMRTPVHILLSYIDILLEEMRRDGEPVAALDLDIFEILPRMRRRALELSDLVNATLDLSRLESGRLPVAHERFELGALIEEVRDSACDLLRGGAVEIRTDLRVTGAVESDRVKLRDVLRNLVTNAIKFTRSGSVTIAAASDGPDLVVSVRDTGTGIPEDQLDSIFEAFHQVGTEPVQGTSGFGLGLHLVKRFVRLLGGSVDVASTVGKGSEFSVRLPGVVTPEPGHAEIEPVAGSIRADKQAARLANP
jgi:signal transduction histidine kinase